MKAPSVIVCAMLVFTSSGLLLAEDDAQPAPGEPKFLRRDKDCGAYAVGIVLRALGREVPSFERLREAAKVDEEGETTLLAVRDALAHFDVPTTALADVRDIDIDEDSLAVARMIKSERGGTQSHFVVLARKDDEFAVVYSPPNVAYIDRWTSLNKRLDGPALVTRPRRLWLRGAGAALLAVGVLLLIRALVRRRRVVQAASAALIAVALIGCDQAPRSSPEHPVGAVLVGTPSDYIDSGIGTPGVRHVDFSVRNATTEEVAVEKVAVSCGCMSVTFDTSKPLLPQEVRDGRAALHLDPNERRTVILRFLSKSKQPHGIVTIVGEAGALTGVRSQEVVDAGQVRVGVPVVVTLPMTIVKSEFNAALRTDRNQNARWRIIRGSTCRIVSKTPMVPDWSSDELDLGARVEVTPLRNGPDDAVLECLIGSFPFRVGIQWVGRSICQAERDIVLLTPRDDGSTQGTVTMRDASKERVISSLQLEPTDQLVATTVQEVRDGEWKVTLRGTKNFVEQGGFCRAWVRAKNKAGANVDRVPLRVALAP